HGRPLGRSGGPARPAPAGRRGARPELLEPDRAGALQGGGAADAEARRLPRGVLDREREPRPAPRLPHARARQLHRGEMSAATPTPAAASTMVELLRRRAAERGDATAYLFLRDGEVEE